MIVQCEECKANISDTAERCPKCGRNRIVNLLPYQVANRTNQQEPTCVYQISYCPNPLCVKCGYKSICNPYKAYCFASQACGIMAALFGIVGVVITIGIILLLLSC